MGSPTAPRSTPARQGSRGEASARRLRRSSEGLVDCRSLAARFWREAPDNESRSEGYALVAVLEPAAFLRERIPGSTRLPANGVAGLVERFDPDKEIVLYDTGPQSAASRRVAGLLVQAGFRRVVDLAEGLRGWRDAGHPLAGAAHC